MSEYVMGGLILKYGNARYDQGRCVSHAEFEALAKVCADLYAEIAAMLAAPSPPAGEGKAWSVLQIGNRGAGYDSPGAKRAFTYDEQPGNIDASKLGGALSIAASTRAGDSIDKGLNLLHALQACGYGVFQIGEAAPQLAAAAPREPASYHWQQRLADIEGRIEPSERELEGLHDDRDLAPAMKGWRPIEDAPKDNKRPLYIAEFSSDGELIELDWDATWEAESESWEMPQVYYIWASARGRFEEPTHFCFMDEGLPTTTPHADAELQRDAERLDWLMLMVSGRELRRIGVDTSGNCTRQDIDAAIQARRQQGDKQ